MTMTASPVDIHPPAPLFEQRPEWVKACPALVEAQAAAVCEAELMQVAASIAVALPPALAVRPRVARRGYSDCRR
jgi:hypothetical protein